MHFYIFAPDYAHFSLGNYNRGEEYSIIKYSELHKFFKDEMQMYIAERAYPDFMRALERHTMPLSELQHKDMEASMLRIIGQSK